MMSVQYTAIFHSCKNDNFQMKMFDIFLIFAQTLEPPQMNEKMNTSVNPSFTI